ncbi:MAG TPA: GNAT family N-acetyltransferase [Caulobacteraceae bacterium]|jgi:GNAT superfamily N-acetyltransferase|nr:GNAT family N-acetyltransferase [Caulobacteraceae bacterium]
MSIRAAAAEDLEKVLDTLTLAFVADPPIRYAWPRPSDYLAGFRRFTVGLGGRGVEHQSAFVTEDFSAAALWLPPGVEPDAESIGALMAETMPEAKLAVIGQVLEQMGGFHPTEPHWYLAAIGVDPARQGRGLGSALLKHALRFCDAQGLPAYLESSNPKNLPLYERHGFEVMDVIQPEDFPPIYPMLRNARR